MLMHAKLQRGKLGRTDIVDLKRDGRKRLSATQRSRYCYAVELSTVTWWRNP